VPIHIEDVAEGVLISLRMTCSVVLAAPPGHCAITAWSISDRQSTVGVFFRCTVAAAAGRTGLDAQGCCGVATSMSFRKAVRPRESRDRIVPTGTPQADAISR